jgi:TPR repeat protein
MGNSFKLFIFSFFFAITTATAQAADLFSEIRDGSADSGSSLEQPGGPKQLQPTVQKIAETEEKNQSEKKKSEKKKPKEKISSQTTTPSGPSQEASDMKPAVEMSDVQRVEKWLEANEAAEKERQVKKVRKPAKKSTQTFSVYLSPEPDENKTDSKQPEKKSHFNAPLPVKPPMTLPAKTLKPPLAPEISNETKQAEEATNFQSEIESAESGDPEAQLSAGIKLYKGQGVLQDREKGFKWLLKAAEEGKHSPESLHILGQAYFNGTDTEKNYVEARKWLNLLADQDNYSAKNDLAYMLYNGLGGDKDYAKSFELYKQASKHGDVFAQANLGLMYATGTGTEIDKARAYAWYSIAASRGNRAAERNRNDLLKDMSWEELNLAQKITVELYNEVATHQAEKPGANTGQLEQSKLKQKQFNRESRK